MNRPVMRRKTYDGKVVELWSDGLVTFMAGFGVPGVGVSRSRWVQKKDFEAGMAALKEIELFDAREVGPAIRAARKLFRRWNWAGNPPEPGHVRRAMAVACGKDGAE